jgi:hypothetical protein
LHQISSRQKSALIATNQLISESSMKRLTLPVGLLLATVSTALTNLVTALSDDQKKTADELLAPHIGMMAMMTAMQSGQMGPGQMQPGNQMQPGKMMPGR